MLIWKRVFISCNFYERYKHLELSEFFRILNCDGQGLYSPILSYDFSYDPMAIAGQYMRL